YTERMMPRPLFQKNGCWEPFQEKRQNLFNQNIDLPNFLEPVEVSWIESARKRLGTSTWPGSMRLPLFSSLCMEVTSKSCTGSEGCNSESVCKQTKGRQNWKICLDVSPFSPEEINIKSKEGYLEITGMMTLICLLIKFFLDLKQISSMLSSDGILSVEAPLAGSSSLPGETVIPIHMMDKQLSAKSDGQCITSNL
uniref:Heat shock protein, alpha-crystallin-related, b15 n=1 Tax=Cyprinus carpio TaxID=7962 RepID=A0A8C2BGH9_CYPCA